MKISYNWLKDFIETDLSPDEMADVLTHTGLEVATVKKFESIKGGLEGLVIGKVVEKEKHPNADKLSLTKVDIGNGEPLSIVCGAPNVDKGQKVVVATVGTTIHPINGEPFEIRKAKIRGEESMGMICAEDEIGLGDNHDGIMILDDDLPIGKSFKELHEIYTDHTIEIDLTPNRTDGMSHYGVARDIAAVLNLSSPVSVNRPDEIDLQHKVENTISVTLKDEEKCPRYAGLEIRGVKVSESPEWLKNRLLAVGMVPINNVVDITNYVQLEFGQPLHAFNADKIAGNEVVVRRAKKGEKFITLDEKERTLDSEDLMICDKKEGMCIGGVFGGIKSGVVEKTKNVFLEAAYFNPVSIRKTAKRHQLNTDASFRFERGVDPEMTIHALKRAASLIQEIGGGDISKEIIDIYPSEIKPVEIEYNFKYADDLIGKSIPADQVKSILESLDFRILAESDQILKLEAPQYRVDVQRPADVVEEVLRIYGYNNVELPHQMKISLIHNDEIDQDKYINATSDYLVARGFTEIMSNSLTKADYKEQLANEGVVEMLNPLSSELNVLRHSLLFNGLEAIVHNQNRQRDDLRLFEFGRVYQKSKVGFEEKFQLSIFITGSAQPENWNNEDVESNTWDISEIVNGVLEKIGIKGGLRLIPSGNGLYDNAVDIFKGKKPIGRMGILSGSAQKKFDIHKKVFMAELFWDELLQLIPKGDIEFAELPKYPTTRRDFSLLLDSTVSFKDIERIAFEKGGSILRDVGLFDVYEGDKIPKGKKSYAVKFIWQDLKETLKDEKVDELMNQIRDGLEKELNASLR